MTGWLIALGIVLVIILIPLLPVGMLVIYNKEGLQLFVHIWFLKFPLDIFKSTKKDEGKTSESESGLKKFTSRAKKAITDKEGGKISEFMPLLDVSLKLLADLRRKIYVKNLSLNLILGGEDACELALNYGRAWAAVGNLMPQLDRLFVIRKRDVEVECDFTASKTLVIARLDITLTLGRLLALVVVIAIRALKIFLQIKKKRKGGAAT